MRKILKIIFLMVSIALLFGLRTVFAGTALYNAVEDRIEYNGVITIEDVYQQVNDPAYLEKQSTNKYIIYKDMFGDKNSELDLSNSEFVFDGFWQILSYGKIIMNDAFIYSINGQGLIKCYRGASGIDPNNFGLFANNLRWQETSLESNGNSNSFYYKSIITNSSMEGFTFPTSPNRLTPYWPSYISTLRIDYSLNSELRNLTFRDFIFTLPADTFGSYNALISLASSEGVLIDTVTFDNINMNMRDNSGGSLIGKWSSSIQVKNVTGTRLNLGYGLGEHETSGASYTYSNISLEGINIPPSNLLTIGWNRYNHSGNIEKLTKATFKNFITGIQSNTGGGIDVDDFLISDVITGASLGVTWSHSLLYGSPFGSRSLKHGTIQNAERGYTLTGTATSTGYGEPIPEEWGLSTVYSEDVTINAGNTAINTGYPSGHRFYGLNDTYNGNNYDIYINKDDFWLNLINCTFNPAKTYVSGSGSFIKDYRLITIKIINQFDEPVSGANVEVIPQNGGEFIRSDGIAQNIFITDESGYTAIAANDKTNAPALLNWKKTGAGETKNYVYVIQANKEGNTTSSNSISPGEIFDYRNYGNVLTLKLVMDITDTNLSKVNVYPNPYVAKKYGANKITFANLPKEATIRIYTLSGELIKTIKHKDIADGGSENWDISGIPSGVYMYNIVCPEGIKKGKVGMIK